MSIAMSVNIDTNKPKVVKPELVEKRKLQLGKFLNRLRRQSKRMDGRRLTCADVAKNAGVSAQTVSNAEKGVLNLNTLIAVLAVYKADSVIDAFELFNDEEITNQVPPPILQKINESIPLSTVEFEEVITLYPDDEFEVSFRAYRDLKELGYDLELRKTKTHTHYFARLSEAMKN